MSNKAISIGQYQCIKPVIMADSYPAAFTLNRIYHLYKSEIEDEYFFRDDENEPHYTGDPGNDWLKTHFVKHN